MKKYDDENFASTIDLITYHYKDILSFYGNDLGVKVARKHLSWYMDQLGVFTNSRQSILTENCPDRVICKLLNLFESREAA